MGTHYANLVRSLAPLAYWRFGEATGSTAVDASGNGRNVTLTRTRSMGVVGAIDYDPNAAVDFTTIGLQGLGSGWPFTTADNFTWSLWAKPAGTGFWTVSFGGFNVSIFGFLSGSSWTLVTKGESGTTLGEQVHATGMTTGVWHHMAIAWDAATRKTYVDGALSTSHARLAHKYLASYQLTIGVGADSAAMAVDEFSVHGAALTATQVAALYAAGKQRYLPLDREGGVAA